MRVRIWDAPTRLFHWLVVALIPLLWWTAEEERLDLHRPLGLAMLGLLAFRLLWGLVGGSTARFAGFVRGPSAAFAYLRGRSRPSIGHNPLGAFSVLAMLAALAVQVGLGLFATDGDGLESGPLAHLVDYETSKEIAELHEANFDILLVLIGLHLAAIVYYAAARRRDLVTPMVTGRGEAPPGVEPMRPAPVWRFLAAAALAAAAAAWIGGTV